MQCLVYYLFISRISKKCKKK